LLDALLMGTAATASSPGHGGAESHATAGLLDPTADAALGGRLMLDSVAVVGHGRQTEAVAQLLAAWCDPALRRERRSGSPHHGASIGGSLDRDPDFASV
jgi:hypothetical protein